MDHRYESWEKRGRQDRTRAGGGRENEVVDISDESSWGQGSENPKQEESGLSTFPENIDLTITSVQLLKRPKFRYRIFFGPYALDVHEDVMIRYRMIQGAIFTKNDLEEIVSADERQRGYADALLYLSRKPRTAHEISLRLAEKGWSPETIKEVIERLASEGFIDDAAYALEWAGQRVKNRGKGKLWVRHELRQKGVSKPLIEEALNEVSEEDEFDSALQLGAKKWRATKGETLDRKRKTGAFLMRRGYSGGLVSKVISELCLRDGVDGLEDWEDL
ncbi:regulatory protein RecX [Paenibacillus segetis]|uniref:Regulatory protein RecX n=1 Tax=Paenibacillus segetis TaxID=1325360 RepID=A0ABQ1Y9S3_9BACL|nr:RecX family transcriptional regulator [Paenibacillus segetis]GGH18078.1 hypothetical protein GCM10008013_13790 [Paenibacillus segetis]